MKSLNMNATKTMVGNPVEITISETELKCLISILKEFRHMKEVDDFDPNAVSKMKAANIILDRIER